MPKLRFNIGCVTALPLRVCHLEYEIAIPLGLQAVDAQNPDTIALLRGPSAMFAVGNLPEKFTRRVLLAAAPAARNSSELQVVDGVGKFFFVHLGPFMKKRIVSIKT